LLSSQPLCFLSFFVCVVPHGMFASHNTTHYVATTATL
jgi:hypothetical protein